MPRLPIIKSKEFYDSLIKYGCESGGIRGSHYKVINPQSNKTSVVPVHGGTDCKKGTFSGVLKQLEIDVNDFLHFIGKQS